MEKDSFRKLATYLFCHTPKRCFFFGGLDDRMSKGFSQMGSV